MLGQEGQEGTSVFVNAPRGFDQAQHRYPELNAFVAELSDEFTYCDGAGGVRLDRAGVQDGAEAHPALRRSRNAARRCSRSSDVQRASAAASCARTCSRAWA